MCSSVAQAFRIRERHGALHLLDARTSSTDPLYREASRRGLDLDEGIVIATEGRIHHGADAVRVMARYGDPRSPLMALAKPMFHFEWIASNLYPGLRAIRNRLLKNRNIGRIGNLDVGRGQADSSDR
jgi:hypothetical protein